LESKSAGNCGVGEGEIRDVEVIGVDGGHLRVAHDHKYNNDDYKEEDEEAYEAKEAFEESSRRRGASHRRFAVVFVGNAGELLRLRR